MTILEQFKEFFRAIYNLIKYVFGLETGWNPEEE